MDQRTISILFALLRSAIRGTELTEAERSSYRAEMLGPLLKISSKHDVAHLVVLQLKKSELISNEQTDIEKSILAAVYRYERLRQEYEKLCNALEGAQIPFLPLKGAVIRKYYPEAWMRTSCDIDVLVREDDGEKARQILVREHGYTDNGKSSHDFSFFSPGNVDLELHYELMEDAYANDASKVLQQVWHSSTVRDGTAFHYEMPDELFYFYHIAHMAKHFENGGCGIRPVIDLWILDHIRDADKEKRDALLREGKLLKFAQAVRKLSRVWFENEEYDPISKQMEEYILSGGVYGNNQNRIVVQQQKEGGKLRYALSKIWIPYDVIKFQYPVLQKHKWLMPAMEVRRWCKLIFCGHLKRTTRELRYNSGISTEKAEQTQALLRGIGLCLQE